MKKKWYKTLLIIFILFSNSLFALNNEFKHKLKTTLDSVSAQLNIVGAQVAVIMPDHEVWVGTYGLSNLVTNKKMNSDMLLGIGSITKNFIATLTLKLIQENKLSLEDTLSKWIFKDYKNISSKITIRQLLNHTSGVFNFFENELFQTAIVEDFSRHWTPEEILDSYIREPHFEPGTGWYYSNTNYLLLGIILKNATKSSSIAQLLRDYLLNSSDLQNTFLGIEEAIPIEFEIASPYIFYNNNHYDISHENNTAVFSSVWTSGAMYSTATDIAQWVQALYSGEIINKKYLDMMLNFIEIPWKNLDMPSYGLGTIEYSFLENEFWGHGGNIRGYDSMVTYCNDNKISIAVLINENTMKRAEYTITVALWKTVFRNLLTWITNNFISVNKYHLNQNFPNPFNLSTTIKYALKTNSYVSLTIYNIIGQKMILLVDKYQTKGYHQVKWIAEGLPSGIYFYKLQAGEFSDIKKLILQK